MPALFSTGVGYLIGLPGELSDEQLAHALGIHPPHQEATGLATSFFYDDAGDMVLVRVKGDTVVVRKDQEGLQHIVMSELKAAKLGENGIPVDARQLVQGLGRYS